MVLACLWQSRDIVLSTSLSPTHNQFPFSPTGTFATSNQSQITTLSSSNESLSAYEGIFRLPINHWYDSLEHGLDRRSLVTHSGTWTWSPIIGTTLWNIDLVADYWDDTLEHGLGRRLLGRHSGTWTWLPIIGTTLWNMDSTADYWYDTLEHQIGRRSLGRHSRLSNWLPIIITTLSIIKLAADHYNDTLEHQLGMRIDGMAV